MSASLVVSRARCTAVALCASVCAAALAHALVAVAAAPVSDVDDGLVRCSALALLGCLAWAWLAVVAVVAEAWRGASWRVPGVPRMVRRAVLGGCGVALTGALGAGPGVAHDGAGPSLAGLPFPDRAVGRVAPAPPLPQHAANRVVVVRPGDTLWAIATSDLAPGASDRAVAAHSRAIHTANRASIGPDPDLIHPGQRLVLPAPRPTPSTPPEEAP